jgi:mono/diheme cytochrome c family protein
VSNTFTVLALSGVLIATIGVGSSRAQGPQKSTNDGVYSDAQAERGQQIFNTKCGVCHEPDRFKGAGFLESWYGEPLFSLFDTISTTMPADNPGGLSAQQYADVIASFLKVNNYPAGQEELKGNKESMGAVRIDALKAAGSSAP